MFIIALVLIGAVGYIAYYLLLGFVAGKAAQRVVSSGVEQGMKNAAEAQAKDQTEEQRGQNE